VARNPLAELLRRQLTSPAGSEGLRLVLSHRGVPGDLKAIDGRELVSVGRDALVLADGSEIPLHRLREVWRDEVRIYPFASRTPAVPPDDPDTPAKLP
jgi:uncharacterized protein (UPF0248 family)